MRCYYILFCLNDPSLVRRGAASAVGAGDAPD